MAEAESTIKSRAHAVSSRVFVLVLALGSSLAIAQEPNGAAPGSGPGTLSTRTPEPPPLLSGVDKIGTGLEFEFVGVYGPDGRFKETSGRERLLQLGDNKPERRVRPVELPVSLRPHSLERVVENYEPPARASKALKAHSVFASLRDEIITFVYGYEQVLRAPTHVTTDSKQRLILSDPGQPAVHVLDGKNSFRIAGGAGRRLLRPNGVAVDAADNLYVADGQRGMVLVYDSQGRFLRYLGTVRGESLFSVPTGIALDRQAGRLYVLDSPADQLIVLDLRGNVLKRVGDRRDKLRRVNFDHPSEIALANNKVVVLDAAGSRIQILDLACQLLAVFKTRNVSGPPPAREMGMALDSAGNIYLSNIGSSSVRVYRQDGGFVGSFGHSGITGIWIDRSDRIYAADASNGYVEVFQLNSGKRAQTSNSREWLAQ